MPGVADILRRMADDLDFARAVESDPANALRGIDLSIPDLRRIEEAVAAVRGTRPPTPSTNPRPQAVESPQFPPDTLPTPKGQP